MIFGNPRIAAVTVRGGAPKKGDARSSTGLKEAEAGRHVGPKIADTRDEKDAKQEVPGSRSGMVQPEERGSKKQEGGDDAESAVEEAGGGPGQERGETSSRIGTEEADAPGDTRGKEEEARNEAGKREEEGKGTKNEDVDVKALPNQNDARDHGQELGGSDGKVREKKKGSLLKGDDVGGKSGPKEGEEARGDEAVHGRGSPAEEGNNANGRGREREEEGRSKDEGHRAETAGEGPFRETDNQNSEPVGAKQRRSGQKGDTMSIAIKSEVEVVAMEGAKDEPAAVEPLANGHVFLQQDSGEAELQSAMEAAVAATVELRAQAVQLDCSRALLCRSWPEAGGRPLEALVTAVHDLLERKRARGAVTGLRLLPDGAAVVEFAEAGTVQDVLSGQEGGGEKRAGAEVARMKVERFNVAARLENERATGGAEPTEAGSKRPGGGKRAREPGTDEPPSGGGETARLHWERLRGRGSGAGGGAGGEERRRKRNKKRKWEDAAPREQQEVAEKGRRKASGAKCAPEQGTSRPKAHKDRKQPESGEENEVFAPSVLR
jgi:hypothetical protein